MSHAVKPYLTGLMWSLCNSRPLNGEKVSTVNGIMCVALEFSESHALNLNKNGPK